MQVNLLLLRCLLLILATTAPSASVSPPETAPSPAPSDENGTRVPRFAAASASVSVHLGTTARLDCIVHDASDEPVSWLRRVDEVLELLTWGSHTYANDDRYSLVREEGDRWHRWQLVIEDSQLDDRGQYRCQVATQPPLLRTVSLAVIEPRARVVDERGRDVKEKYYNSGSMIELKCIVDRVPFPHGPVVWRRQDTVLAFNTSRGGISLRAKASWGFVRSRLYVANASPADSGVYSCWYKNYTRDTVNVHVIAGENSAAMQHDGLPENSSIKASISTEILWSVFVGCCLSAAFRVTS